MLNYIIFLLCFINLYSSASQDSFKDSIIERNKNRKEEVDEIAKGLLLYGNSLQSFGDCLECFLVLMCSENDPVGMKFIENISEERKRILNESLVQIFKQGYDFLKVKLFFDNAHSFILLDSGKIYEFPSSVRAYYKNAKDFLNSSNHIKEFYDECIEKAKRIIEGYSEDQYYHTDARNEICFKLRVLFSEFKFTYYKIFVDLYRLHKYFSLFLNTYEDFYKNWIQFSEQFKYRVIFGNYCRNIERKVIKFDKILIDEKIKEIKELQREIINHYDNIIKSSLNLDRSETFEEKFEFVYTCEIFLIKSQNLYRFIRENRFYIKSTHIKEGLVVEENIQDKMCNKYLNEIEQISNEIRNNQDIKRYVNIIWGFLLIMITVDNTILDGVIRKKLHKIKNSFEEGNRINISLLSKFVGMEEAAIKNYYERSKLVYLDIMPRRFSKLEKIILI